MANEIVSIGPGMSMALLGKEKHLHPYLNLLGKPIIPSQSNKDLTLHKTGSREKHIKKHSGIHARGLGSATLSGMFYLLAIIVKIVPG